MIESLATPERVWTEGSAAAFTAHAVHRSTPRQTHIMQTKVPQSLQGYPSDARSSLPQLRHIIASRSCNSVMGGGSCIVAFLGIQLRVGHQQPRRKGLGGDRERSLADQLSIGLRRERRLGDDSDVAPPKV